MMNGRWWDDKAGHSVEAVRPHRAAASNKTTTDTENAHQVANPEWEHSLPFNKFSASSSVTHRPSPSGVLLPLAALSSYWSTTMSMERRRGAAGPPSTSSSSSSMNLICSSSSWADDDGGTVGGGLLVAWGMPGGGKLNWLQRSLEKPRPLSP